MPALREIFANFGIEFDKRQLEAGNRAISTSSRNLSVLGSDLKRVGSSMSWFGGIAREAVMRGLGQLTAEVMSSGLDSIVSSTIKSTRELDLWATRLSISREEMLGWQHVGARFGVDIDNVTDALKELQLKAKDALTGGTAQADAFRMIGLRAKELGPVVNDATALMDLFVSALNRNTSAATRAFVTDELLSDAGTRMLPVFAQGTAAIQAQRQAAMRAAGRDLPALARASADLQAAQANLSLRFQGLRNDLTLRLVPAFRETLPRFESLIDKGRKLLPIFDDLVRKSNLLKVALVAAGVAVAVAWGPAAAEVLTVVGPLILVALALEDIVTWIDGGKSAFGDFLIELQGADKAAENLTEVRDMFREIGVWITRAEYFLRGWLGLANRATRIGDPTRRQAAMTAYEGASRAAGIRERAAETYITTARAGIGAVAATSPIALARGDTGQAFSEFFQALRAAPSMLQEGAPMRAEFRVPGPGTLERKTTMRSLESDAQYLYEVASGLRPDVSTETTISAPANVTMNITGTDDPEAVAQLAFDRFLEYEQMTLRDLRSQYGRAQ